MISVKHRGDFTKTENFLKKIGSSKNVMPILEKYGQRGVDLLASVTPMDSGKTALSWDYEIDYDGRAYHLYFTNSNVNDGVNIAIILQYGHGTRDGGYIQGIDYINPAIKQTFEGLKNELLKEVRRS